MALIGCPVNVGQFGTTDKDLDRYKQAGEYALEAKMYRDDSLTIYNELKSDDIQEKIARAEDAANRAETAEIHVADMTATVEADFNIIDGWVKDMSVTPYGFTAAGGEVTVTLPSNFTKVSSIYINGGRQEAGDDFTYNATTHVVTFSSALQPGDRVSVLAGTVYEQTSTLAQTLQGMGGADYVKTGDGESVQQKLNSLKGAVDFITPQMFGAKGDYDPSTKSGTDDTVAFKSAISFAIQNDIKKIRVSGGYYLISDELNLGGTLTSGEGPTDYWRGRTQGVHLEGDGPYSTILVFDPPSIDTPCLSARGGWGSHSPRAISQLAIEPKDFASYDVSSKGTGVLLQGSCFVPITDVHIGRFHRGIHLLNLLQGNNDTSNTFTSGDFTEFNRMTRVRIFNCDIDADYQVTKGNNSFHGNSWTDCMFQINSYGGIGIRMWDDGTRDSITTPTNPYYQFIANVYQNSFGINFFGSNSRTCYMLWLEKAQARNCSGDMTCEAAVTLHTTSFEWFQSYGSYQTISATNLEVGATDTNTRPVAFMWSNIAYPQVMFDGADPILTNTSYPRQFDLNNSGNTGMDLLNIRGTQTGNIWSQAASNVSAGWLFTTRSQSGSRPSQKTTWQFSYSGNLINSPTSDDIEVKAKSSSIKLTPTTFIPTTTTAIDLGRPSTRWNGLYIDSWNMGSGGIVPVVDGAVNVGSNTFRVNRVYTKNVNYANTIFDSSGSGDPNGQVVASVGSTYRRTDGAAGSTFYVKESGTGNTGWVAK